MAGRRTAAAGHKQLVNAAKEVLVDLFNHLIPAHYDANEEDPKGMRYTALLLDFMRRVKETHSKTLVFSET